MPVGPKGLLIVSTLLDTEHWAAVLIDEVTEDNTQVPELRTMVLGNVIDIYELLGIGSEGVKVT